MKACCPFERSVPADEYAYLDAADRVLCRTEYRQSGDTCIGAESRDYVFIVQGHAATPMGLLAEYCGSHRGESWWLG